MTPTLIVTRPEPQVAAFAQAIRDAWNKPLQIILSPLLQIVPVEVNVDLSALDAVIFTSVNGVAQSARLGLARGITAFCVGDRTAAAAQDAGFAAISAAGDAPGLIALVLSHRPSGTLAHVRGQHTRGTIADDLTKAGYMCHDVIAYDQRPMVLTSEAKNALQGKEPVVVPLFSARTSTIFTEMGPFSAPLHVVAISDAALPESLLANTKRVAERPNGEAMIDATLGCLRDIGKNNGHTALT